MDYMVGPSHDRKSLQIKLPEGSGQRILFSLSGGADSAILLYLVAKINRDSGSPHTIQPVTFPRDELAATFANGIINFINEKLGTSIPPTRVHNYGQLEHHQIISTGIYALMESGEFDYVYIAENRIPNADMPGSAPMRADENRKFERLILPFQSFYKYHSIDLYFQEGISELLTLTHSCTEQPRGRCGICFQDHERAWAFKQLGRDDPGTV